MQEVRLDTPDTEREVHADDPLLTQPSLSEAGVQSGPEADPGLAGQIKLLRTDAEYVRASGADYYDHSHKTTHLRMAGHAGLMGTVCLAGAESVNVLNGVGATPAHIAVATAAATGAVATVVTYARSIAPEDGYSGTKQEVPTFNGFTVELMLDHSGGEGTVPAVVSSIIPTKESAIYGMPSADARLFSRIAQESKADKMLLPAAMAAQLQADTIAVHTLQEQLEILKGYSLNAPAGLANEPYVLIEVEPNEAERQLKRSLALLAERFGELHEYSDVPETIEATREMAERLHRLVHRSAELALDVESYRFRDRMGYVERRRQPHYVTPTPAEDVYEPAVWIHRPKNPFGLPPERRTVHELVPEAGMAVEAPHGILTTNDILPALAVALKQLREHEARLRGRDEDLRQWRPEIGTAPRLMRLVRHETDNPTWRHRLKRAIGIGAAAVALVAGAAGGVAAGLQALDSRTTSFSGSSGGSGGSGGSGDSGGSGGPGSSGSPDMAAVTSGVGRAPTGYGSAAPSWRVEGFGMDVAGYYTQDMMYRFDEGLVWHSEPSRGEGWGMPTRVSENEPHITVTRFSHGAEGMYLPVKEGTKIGAVRVIKSDGWISFSHLSIEDDGTAFLELDEDDTGELVKVEYDLVATGQEQMATRSLTVEGVEPVVEAYGDSTDELARDALYTHNTFTYDNTERLDEVMDGLDSPGELYDKLGREQVVNCNVVASYLAVKHEMRDGDDDLAFTTGYMNNGQRYLTTGHAWLTAGTGADQKIIDGTPGLGGRTEEEAGLAGAEEADLDKQWQAMEKRFAHPFEWPDVPWDKLPAAAVGMLAAYVVGSRMRYPLHQWQHRRASSYLTRDQADAIIAQAAWDTEPIIGVPADPQPLSPASLPFGVAAQVAANPRRFAPYLDRAQRRSLSRHARMLLDYHAGL